MKFVISFIVSALAASASIAQTTTESSMPAFYTFTMKTIDGKDKPLVQYKGDVLMVVNVASFCGYTPQYKDLEDLYESYKDKGFKILAFPANNFGSQEPGTNEEIKSFCETNYKVSFDLFSKISVKGIDQHPLYQYLTKESEFKGEIGWNFTKFLVDRNGNIVARYSTRVVPTAKEVQQKIAELIAAK